MLWIFLLDADKGQARQGFLSESLDTCSNSGLGTSTLTMAHAWGETQRSHSLQLIGD
jgi:hypothetical protein